MALSFEEERKMQILKQKHLREKLRLQKTITRDEHNQKMLRLDKLEDIVKHGSLPVIPEV